MERLSFKMIRLTVLLIALLMIGCNERTEKKPEIILNKAEMEGLLKEWKRDSLGCLRTRDPEKMKIYAKQLVGKDSLELIRQLGRPNHRYGQKTKRHFKIRFATGTVTDDKTFDSLYVAASETRNSLLTFKIEA